MTDIDTLIDRLSERQRREFALWCAERVRHLMSNERSTAALDVAARHLRGEATNAELAAASTAAWVAAARAASWDAAWAAWAAAAAASAWDAAWDVARAAALAAARASAWDTERAAQRAELERMLKEVTS
jgi:hypothetical protein